MSNSSVLLASGNFLKYLGFKILKDVGQDIGPLIPDWVWILIVGIFIGVVIIALLNKD
jgi:hypothetical protein